MGIALLALVVSLYLIRAEKAPIPKPVITDEELDKGIKLKDIHYTHDDPDEEIKWILDAREVKFSKDRSYFSFREFKLKLETKSRPPINFKGKRGDFNKTTGDITLMNDLYGTSVEGYTLKAEYLHYNQKTGILKSDKPVFITGPFFTISGQGLYFSLKDEFVRLDSGVTTTITKDVLIS